MSNQVIMMIISNSLKYIYARTYLKMNPHNITMHKSKIPIYIVISDMAIMDILELLKRVCYFVFKCGTNAAALHFGATGALNSPIQY